MYRLAVVMALMLLVAPLAATTASGEIWPAMQAGAGQAALSQEKQQADFWKKFDADMARADRDLQAAFPDTRKGGSIPRTK